MKSAYAGLCLAAITSTMFAGAAVAQGDGDFWTGKWTDQTFETRTMPDGSETQRETSVGSVCIDAGNDMVSSIEDTFLKVYSDRQCTISDLTFEAATENLTAMNGQLTCGPLTGTLVVKYSNVLVNVSSLFTIDTGSGEMTVHTRSRWVRTGDPC
ncbi:hypothetical protein WNY37_09165 [Henriciella sp. AS95]|uniref:hypothetical protein n=1 Tax=Henriciella sp. AS95 TaxID=3135782 RepID=UPI00317EE9F1